MDLSVKNCNTVDCDVVSGLHHAIRQWKDSQRFDNTADSAWS